MLTSPCRAIHLLIPSRFIHYSDRNAAMPTTPESALWAAPLLASSSRSMKETTSGQAAAPSTSPWSPLQKPPRFPADGEASMEIVIVFPGAGHHRRHQLPSLPMDGRLGLSTLTRSSLPPPPNTSITVASPGFFRRINSLAMQPSPLAPLSSSTPAISGDETTFDGFARKPSAFSPLVASAEEPPFAADADGKPACAASILRRLLLLLLLPFLH